MFLLTDRNQLQNKDGCKGQHLANKMEPEYEHGVTTCAIHTAPALQTVNWMSIKKSHTINNYAEHEAQCINKAWNEHNLCQHCAFSNLCKCELSLFDRIKSYGNQESKVNDNCWCLIKFNLVLLWLSPASIVKRIAYGQEVNDEARNNQECKSENE